MRRGYTIKAKGQKLYSNIYGDFVLPIFGFAP